MTTWISYPIWQLEGFIYKAFKIFDTLTGQWSYMTNIIVILYEVIKHWYNSLWGNKAEQRKRKILWAPVNTHSRTISDSSQTKLLSSVWREINSHNLKIHEEWSTSSMSRERARSIAISNYGSNLMSVIQFSVLVIHHAWISALNCMTWPRGWIVSICSRSRDVEVEEGLWIRGRQSASIARESKSLVSYLETRN